MFTRSARSNDASASGATSSTTSSSRFRRLAAVGVAATLVGAGAISTHISANDGDESETPAPPGVPLGEGDLQLGQSNLVQTSGSTFDPTVLTKFIPAMGFTARQGENSTSDTTSLSENCVHPAPNSGGVSTRMFAPVELPDGSQINRVIFYGHDSDPDENIEIWLHRDQIATSLGVAGQPTPATRSYSKVANFSTTGSQPNGSAFASDVILDEIAGSLASSTGAIFALEFPHRFHSVEVSLQNSSGALHLLCGVEVQYQVPASSADAGTVFHPLDSYRAFDSRRASFAESGLLAPNTSKVVSVADGYDDAGVAIPAQAGLVPSNATAVTYNITVAATTGANFVAVTAGDATDFTASAINYNPGANIANAGTVSIDGDQQIKLWGGNGFGSGQVLIDITGYYAPAPPVANMGN